MQKKKSTNSGWMDISVPLHEGMVHWPNDPGYSLRRVQEIVYGGHANLSAVTMGAHSGTHVDAPLHFIEGGVDVSKMPLENMVGRARVIEIRDPESVKLDELLPHHIRRGERILFKTRGASRVWQTNSFVEDYVYVSAEAADYLVARGVRTVGIDYLSIGGYHRGDGAYVHLTLLAAGIWIIEGLDLSRVKPGRYDFICLPLRIQGTEAAPARAIIRRVG